jgi:hypothetical protein
MRLDLFLPFLRRPKKGTEPKPPGLLFRASRAIFPASFFSDPMKGKAGRVRRFIKKIRPVYATSPLRPGVHAKSFLAILVYLF